MTLPPPPFGRDVIESLIPHRPPFLLVDEILELDPGKRAVGRREVRADDWWFPGHFPERPVMPGVLTIEAIAQTGAVAVLAHEENAGKLRSSPASTAAGSRGRRAGRRAHVGGEFVRVRGPIAKGQGRALVGDEPRGRGDAHGLRRRMIGATQEGLNVSITGLGCKVPDRVITNEDQAVRRYLQRVDPRRTGIRERRMASGRRRCRTSRLPACVDAIAQAGVEGKDIDLLIVATVTPDMTFPSTGAILADKLGAVDAAAHDLSAGCTGFMYALAQAYGMLAAGLAKRALVVGGDLLSKILDWTTARPRPLREGRRRLQQETQQWARFATGVSKMLLAGK
jgi:3-hydroxymyristoyl/3-hydroxydecanoyl-(acyl carrier protein) dehydratase